MEWAERLHRDVLKCRKARRVQKEMMMATAKCPEHKTDPKTRQAACKKTGKA